MSALFAGVDRALFVASLGDRLRRSGIPADFSSVTRCAASLEAIGPLTRDDLYWATRLSFVHRHDEITRFDAVFAAIFDVTNDARPSRGRRLPPLRATHEADDRFESLRVSQAGEAEQGGGVPWTTLPSVTSSDDDDNETDPLAIPELMPSLQESTADTPFDLLDEAELLRIGAVLERAMSSWPQRRSRRRQHWASGQRPELRSTMRRALRTGGEPLTIERSRHRQRPRRVVVLVDVSGSMESFARAQLHVTRALVMAGRAEVFAFATELTRITPSLRHRSPVEAIDRASADVGDRFGGTRIATTVQTLLRHPRWSGLVRGSIVLITSDGWDTDPPEELAAAMAKLDRLAHRIVWSNPRVASEGFEPLVGAMAAALPFCDEFLPGHSARAMDDVMTALAAR